MFINSPTPVITTTRLDPPKLMNGSDTPVKGSTAVITATLSSAS
jgi:hypothetical protein